MAEMKQLKITDDVVHKMVREGYVPDDVLQQSSIEGESISNCNLVVNANG